MDSHAAATELLRAAGLPESTAARLHLPGRDPVLPSSFRLATAAQTCIGAAAAAADALRERRTGRVQAVTVAASDAALECTGWFTLDGRKPELWDPLSGLYRCANGFVRVHANFAHHRDGALALAGLAPGSPRAVLEAALADRDASQFEEAAAQRGLVVAALRTFDQWDAHPHAAVVREQPLVAIEKIGDAPPLAWPALIDDARPLEGLKVLELTRILAGPVAGRALAAWGADVMLLNAPHLPNIDAIAETSRGKLSTHLDLRDAADRDAMHALLAEAQLFVQGYRPGALDALGFGAGALAARRPGIVIASLSAYGEEGPWGGRRGFDSLVQTATGFNHAEGQAFGDGRPRALPCQMIDYAAGYLLALGALAALHRQQREGGSWRVLVSLVRTALWLRSLGRIEGGFAAVPPSFADRVEETDSGFGRLAALRHPVHFGETPARWVRPSMPPGSHPPRWPS